MKKILAFALLLLISSSIYGTPDDGIREQDILIGYNEDFYYSIKVIHYPTGIYFRRLDSVFIFERELLTGKEVTRTFLRTTTHRDTTTLGDWVTLEKINGEFNYGKFLINHSIKYLFPSVFQNTMYRPVRVLIDNEGLKLRYKNDTVIMEDIQTVEKFAPWINESLEFQRKFKQKFTRANKEFVIVRDFVGEGKYLFVILESKIDPVTYQSIMVLDMVKFDMAKQTIIDRLE